MTDDLKTARAKGYYESPFQPSQGVAIEGRVANALEYIAYQLWSINQKLEKLSEAGDKPSA